MSDKFEPTMRLTFQGSMPVHSDEDALVLYDELKLFLGRTDPKFTLNGQVVMMLEPCCKERKETKSDEQISHMG